MPVDDVSALLTAAGVALAALAALRGLVLPLVLGLWPRRP
jgi:hypothetical protein